MKILVCDETQKALVFGIGFKDKSVCLQRRRVKMLEASTASQIHDKGVVVITKFAKYFITFFNDLGRITGQFLQIVVAFAGYHEPVRFALNVKFELFEIAHLKRRIVKNVVICGTKRIHRVTRRRQTRRYTPVAVRIDLNGRCRLQLIFYKKQRRRVVPKGVLVIKLIRADSKLVCIHEIRRNDFFRTFCINLPSVLICFSPSQIGPACVFCGEILDMPRVLADEIAARRPNRHFQLGLGGHLLPFHTHFDLEQVRPRF